MMVIVVMGVSGSGKTTVGVRLAERLGTGYADADAFHPPVNVEKMAAGIPLTDEDRAPWLRSTASWIADRGERGGVVSCSALRRRYRDVLRTGGDVWFLHLAGSMALLTARIQARTDHFMPVSLLESQFADLEPLESDEFGRVVQVSNSVAGVVTEAVAAYRGARADIEARRAGR
ncbi:gluconokinase [Nocardia sp. NPDC051750]|uniref:gluconokinase n=1 Tax=Nocardia sp. NPDC051750 TaxID=3364325 RepID=UPI00378E84DE